MEILIFLTFLKSLNFFFVNKNLDHPLHGVFILAGLWGFRPEYDRTLAQKLFQKIVDPSMRKWHRLNRNDKQADQTFLDKHLRPFIETSLTAHDSFHCLRFRSSSRPFPKQRPSSYYCHVGGYGCCGAQFLNASFPHECPYECRPHEHKEWVFC